jgi:alginate O-acetyltransferase complex protein AlgJ
MKLKSTFTYCALVAAATLSLSAQAQDGSTVVVGKNNWLFTKYEFAHPSDAADTQATIQMLEKINKMFERKGIALALAIVPSKIRVNADQLPDGVKLDEYTAQKYENAVKSLKASGVNVVNLNQSFLNSPDREGEKSLFMRLDTHWSNSGAMLAAETIKAEIDANPILKAAWGATPEEKYTLTWNARSTPVRTRDLVRLLPSGSANYPPELVLQFKVKRDNESSAGLLAGADATLITAIGSSYSNKNTGYPDALRYVLQRNILDISIPVDQGPWVGMESYLKDEAFKTTKPKMIIWEIPERELRSPPNYKHRDARYVIDNNDWLSRVDALLK